MARRRELERISLRRRELRNARARVDRATERITSFKEGSGKRNQARGFAVKAVIDAQRARGKLEVALKAPAREKLRDLEKRPGRFKNLTKARQRFKKLEQTAETKVKQVRQTRLRGREGKALKLIEKARKEGKSPEDVFKLISRQTGLSPSAVFTMFKYAGGPKK